MVEVKDKEIIHKIKDVLRLKENGDIYVFDGEGSEYIYKIRGIDRDVVVLEKKKQARKETVALNKVILGFPLIREAKIDFILQKTTELGVTGFSPFISARSLQTKPSISKIKRWRKIIVEAVRQSGRLWIPEVYEATSLGEIAKKDYSLKIAASIEGMSPKEVLSKNEGDVFIVVGPEGDFSYEEYDELKREGFKFIKLSQYILRTETAAIFAVGLVRMVYEEAHSS